MINQEIEDLIKKAVKDLQKNKEPFGPSASFSAGPAQGKLPKFEIPEIIVEVPDNPAFGDYTSNIALQISKATKDNLYKLALAIVNQFAQIQTLAGVRIGKVIRKVQAVDGFINFWISNDYLAANLQKITHEKDKYGSSIIGNGKTVLVDYSGPNIAKPFGIGHLRSTIIGQAIYNIYKFLGYNCVGDNHLGDWGTQFGKLIYQIIKDGIRIDALTIQELERLYVDFHKQAQFNLSMEDGARRWFKALEKGDPDARKIFEACWDLSVQEFDRIYKILGIKIDYNLGESFYEDKMKDIIKEALKKKVAKKSKKALIVEFPKNELPILVLVKSDGTTTYFLRDLATIRYRIKRWNPDIFIYEVGNDQALHFKQLFRTVELFGWKGKAEFIHMAHGLVRSKKGKFSTRKGETIHLEEVLDEGIERAKKTIEESKNNRGLSGKAIQELANIIGIGAIKYNDLSQHHSRDVIFEWNKVLNLKGNSGPYLQYTYVRCQSLLRKSGLRVNDISNGFVGFITGGEAVHSISPNEQELKLLRQIVHFPEVIQKAAETFSPNLISSFIFSLAQGYNLFYDNNTILKLVSQEQKKFRLALSFAVGQIIKTGLNLLGIQVPEKM